MIDIRIQSGDFDAGAQLERLAELRVAGVSGFVARLEATEDVEEIWIDHHAQLARTELSRIADEAVARWPLAGIILMHRQGRLDPGEQALFAGIAASDPLAANGACGWIVDQVRCRAPFWRKEILANGTERWWRPEGDQAGLQTPYHARSGASSI